MAMESKEQVVASLREEFTAAQAAFVIDYTKCTCAELTSLRRKLRPVGAKLHIVKNTLARRAVRDSQSKDLENFLQGQTAIIWSKNDPVTPAKLLTEFAKQKESGFAIRAAVVDGALVTGKEIDSLAKMPSREALLSTLLGLLNAPAVKLLRTINEPGASLARVIEAWRAKQESSGK